MASTINIQLTDHLRQHVDFRTSDDDVYSTPSEYLRDLIRRDMEKYQAAREIEIAQMLMDARNSPTSPLDKEFFNRIRAKYKNTPVKKKKQP